MQLDPRHFNDVLEEFHSVWPVNRVEQMTIAEYADLSDHDSFCYWLEYGSPKLGDIGGIALNKFELWKPKNNSDFNPKYFHYDGVYAWKASNGDDSVTAFLAIRQRVLETIYNARSQNWRAIETIPLNAIAKWKIAFLYSDKQLLPVYSKRALLLIAKGLGKEFNYSTPVYELQAYILGFKNDSEPIDDFAYRVYTAYAEKKEARNYFIIGSKYSNEKGEDKVSKIEEFKKHQCVAIGFIDWLDFSSYMGAPKSETNKFSANWTLDKPAWPKIQSYFYLLSKIKEGDIIAVKSHGSHNNLTIIAYAEVIKRNGSIYQHCPDELGHHIHVEFLDSDFSRPIGLNYAATIHHLTPERHGDDFYKVFGWYVTSEQKEEIEDESTFGQWNMPSGYNEKLEGAYERSATIAGPVNLIHSRIQNRFWKYLESNFPNDRCFGEKRRIDAQRESDTEIYIYEIKPFQSVFYCIRDGIGQLIDYAHQQKSPKKKTLVIVGPNEPTPSDMEFISAVRTSLNIPFSYLAFDEKNLTAQEF